MLRLEEALKNLEKEGLIRAELKLSGKLVKYYRGRWKISPLPVDFIEDIKEYSKVIGLIIGIVVLISLVIFLLVLAM